MNNMEKKIISHKDLFLGYEEFICGCGNTGGHTKHVLLFSDGERREECDMCFIKDLDAEKAGLLDDPKSFILQTERSSKLKKPKTEPPILTPSF